MDAKTVLDVLSDVKIDIELCENNWKSVVAGRIITERQLVLLEEQIDANIIEKLAKLSKDIKKNHHKFL